MKTRNKTLHKYSKGDIIRLRKPGATLCTLALPQQSPYKVIKYHENGSIKHKLKPTVADRVNICRCYPYYRLPEDEDPDANTQQAVNVPTTFV